MIDAKVIAHSTYDGAAEEDELITLEVNFHRFILPELNTHRVLSRNYQSSRAVPVEKLIDQVRNNPATPVHWGKNQRGMVAEQEITNYKDFGQGEYQWFGAANEAANRAAVLNKQGYHKQIVNRILEPFMWTKGVITATRGGWDSVFALRCHPDAQPEFQALAYKMREVIEDSVPTVLRVGEWHLPYVNTTEFVSNLGKISYFTGDLWSDKMEIFKIGDAIKISTSCCAQVSYRQLDDSLEKALKIYDMLNLPEDGKFKESPAHMSPCEHQAVVMEDVAGQVFGGNFFTVNGLSKWGQHRKILELGQEKEFIK